jgi:hypothetical protein
LNVLSLPPATTIISKLEYVEINTLSIDLLIIFSSFQAGIITETCGKFIGSLLDSTVSIGLIYKKFMQIQINKINGIINIIFIHIKSYKTNIIYDKTIKYKI